MSNPFPNIIYYHGDTDVCYSPVLSSIRYFQSLTRSRFLEFFLVLGGGVFGVMLSSLQTGQHHRS
jgi:hypothetical protein